MFEESEDKKMTDKEKAIIMAHTGICMLTGDKFRIFHKYVEDIMGRPIMTHEIVWLADTIKEKSKDDFLVLCAEQEPCEDCISREKAKQFLYERLDRLNDDELYDIFSKIIDDMYNELSSVVPQSKISKQVESEEK